MQDGWTALYKASQQRHFEVVIMLLEAKAGVNIESNVSQTAFMVHGVYVLHG